MSAVTTDDLVVIPAQLGGEATVTLTELLSSFYLWLLLWLTVWVAIPTVLLSWSPVVITSGSMGPNISAGDIVLITEPAVADGELLEQGTVITFRSKSQGGALVTHRIDGVREDGLYRTRGDANEKADSTPVAPEDVVGVGRMLVPIIGLPLLWLSSDLVSFGIFLGATAAAAVAASASHGAGERIREQRRDVAASEDQP